MPFIAAISKENDCNFIRNSLIKNSKKNKFEVINVNEKNIENIKNVRFDIVVIDEDIKEFLSKSNYLDNIINSSKYVLVNTDNIYQVDFVKNQNIKVITYGLNNSADFTISSISDYVIMVCLQGSIEKINKDLIEQQEFSISMKKNNLKKVHNMLPIFIILCIYGDFLKKI